ncbi:MAG: hypothetical protein IT172_02060 [Acidobacteria bacterium]|nr:hypothetical protein [Acidobacteriota bacterium]
MKKLMADFEAARDRLLDLGKDLVSSDVGGWTKAQRLFEMAKQIDLVRTELKDMVSPEKSILPDCTVDTANPILKRNGKTAIKVRSDYPKFSIRGDTLVKIGLGRDLRSEYEHFVSRGAFETVLRRLDVFTKVDEFVADEVQEELDLPTYQTYIVLAVLKELGLVDSPRRGVYSLRGRENTLLSVDRIWNQLAQ